MRILLLCLVLLLGLFQYQFWFDKNGYMDYQNVRAKIAVSKQENEVLSQKNQVVAAEIKDLKQGVDAIEEGARYQHNMVKPNETFYQIVKGSK